MESDNDIRAWLILLRAPGIGAATARALIERTGTVQAACSEPRRLRRECGLSDEAVTWLEAPDEATLDADLAWLSQPDHHLLRYTDPDFPPQLAEIPQPPAALFVVGEPALLLGAQIAVVGARSASAQGMANAREFARAFARAGLTVTSGLADGIDGAAHAGALEAQGTTVAVIGTGADLVYPRKHRELAARIAQHGAIVSEYPLGTGARAEHFPQRNRLIAALALGTLVVEASLQSGSLITARLASETGREVFALPGSIHNPLSRGCHKLIREGARLTETAQEAIGALAPGAQALGAQLRERLEPGPPAGASAPTRAGDPDYARLLAALGEAPLGLDELASRTGLKPAELSSMLLLLELEGAVAPAVNGRWQRLFLPSA